jgi:hypothetical protein
VRVSGWLGLDWGNVPAWVGTIVTSSSFAVAALSYRRSVFDKERAQASTVAALVTRRMREDGTQRQVLLVSNGSDAPVYEVAVHVLGIPEPYWLEQVPAKETSERELLPKGARLTFSVDGVPIGDDLGAVLGALPQLEFRDAAGRWWTKDSDGRLMRLRPKVAGGSRRRGVTTVTSRLYQGLSEERTDESPPLSQH